MRRMATLAAMAALFVGADTAQAATVANGDFETGNLTGWTVGSTSASGTGYWFAYTGTVAPLTGVPLSSTVAAPPEGNYAALSDEVSPGRHILYQDVNLEQVAPGASVKLSLYAYYKAQQGPLGTPSPATLDPSVAGVNEQYRIDVMKPSAPINSVAPADVLLNVFQTHTGNPQTLAPTQMTADLTPFAGQTVRLRFAEVDNNGVLNASTDDVRIRFRPAMSTTASRNAGEIVDSANLAGGPGLSGQITFSLYGPSDPACAGSPIFSSSTAVKGSGVYSSGAFKPTGPGTYRWIASYSGDADNEAVSGACGDPGETVEVPPPPTISKLRVDPNRFRAGSTDTPLDARALTTARIRFTLSADATVRFLINHAPSTRRGKPKHAHVFTRSLKAGNRAVRFTGALDGLTFGRGPYVVYARATAPDGQRSERKSARFRIVDSG